MGKNGNSISDTDADSQQRESGGSGGRARHRRLPLHRQIPGAILPNDLPAVFCVVLSGRRLRRSRRKRDRAIGSKTGRWKERCAERANSRSQRFVRLVRPVCAKEINRYPPEGVELFTPADRTDKMDRLQDSPEKGACRKGGEAMNAKQIGNLLLTVLKHPVTQEALTLLMKRGRKAAKRK